MHTTTKLVFALVITAGLAVTAAAIRLDRHALAAQSTSTIQLAKIVVTPANAEPETIQLDTVVVTPTAADWRYAKTYGVSRTLAANVTLAPIVVRPTAEQLAEIATPQMAAGASAPAAGVTEEDAAVAALMEALDTFSPGQFLNTNAALQALNALVFNDAGR